MLQVAVLPYDSDNLFSHNCMPLTEHKDLCIFPHVIFSDKYCSTYSYKDSELIFFCSLITAIIVVSLFYTVFFKKKGNKKAKSKDCSDNNEGCQDKVQ